VSQVCHFPNELSFSNELLLREQKPFYLADADLDWGQDHLRLCRLVQQKGWTHVKLALFAGADPYFYGLDWTPWTEKDMEGPQPGWVYLVDTSFFQLAPVFFPETAPMAQGWASKMKPTGQLGDCWYYFTVGGEISKDTSPYLHSAPVYRYFWKDGTRVFY
jgi:hypothetical protein